MQHLIFKTHKKSCDILSKLISDRLKLIVSIFLLVWLVVLAAAVLVIEIRLTKNIQFCATDKLFSSSNLQSIQDI